MGIVNIPADSEQHVILVVDYHEQDRARLVNMLIRLGFRVVEAADGHEAIKQCGNHAPWLVITEVFLPGLDGFEVSRHIKQHAGERFIPVLFVTRARDEGVYERCIDAGGDDFLQGPIASLSVLKVKLFAMQRITRLYHEVKELHGFLQREEEVAEELFSRAIEGMNVATDQVRFYKKPASTFSGDVLLTAWRPDGDLNVLLGDFTGHGLTSVIGALPLAETFRAMTRKGYQGHEVLQHINTKLKSLLPPGMFLATIMVQLSVDASQAFIWNCGMPAVIILSPGCNQPVSMVESADPPLGIIAEFVPAPARCVVLAPDDRILLVSDGVLEARNFKGEMFSEQRLIGAACEGMRKGNVAAEVILAAEQFMAGREQDDDVSLIEIPAQLYGLEKNAAARRVTDEEVLTSEGGGNWVLTLKGTMLRQNPVPVLMSQLQEMLGGGKHWQVVFTILTELYVNALDHGVLQLDSRLKSSVDGFARYFALREQRLAQLQDGEVQISLAYHSGPCSGGQLEIMIRDSGNGFDIASSSPGECCQSEQHDALALCGRGICLVQELADSLTYHEGGCCAHAVVSW
ncbi:MAG: SpoIIE family protein phosphatase [Marinobacterium sp.]|nr:SpoIIE family protein phosphatase [Marinobacterium sp.]